MPKGPRDPDHQPFEFRPGVGGFPQFGGMRKQGNPGSTPPNMFHHLKNVRIAGDEIVSRYGQIDCGFVPDEMIGLHVLVEDETDGGDVLLGRSQMTCNQVYAAQGISTLAYEKAIQVVDSDTFDFPLADLDGIAYSLRAVETGPGTTITTGTATTTTIQKVDSFGVHGAPLTSIEIPVDASDVIRTQAFGAGLNKLWVLIGSPTDTAFSKVYSFEPTTETLTLDDSAVGKVVDATIDFAYFIPYREEMFLFARTGTAAGAYWIRRRKQDGTWSTITNPTGFDFLAFPRPAAVYKDVFYLLKGKTESGTTTQINSWNTATNLFDTLGNSIALGVTGSPSNAVGGAAIHVHKKVLYFMWAGDPLLNSLVNGTAYIGSYDGTTWTDNLGDIWPGVGVVANGLLYSYAGKLWATIPSPTNFADLSYSEDAITWTTSTGGTTGAYFRVATPKRF